MVRAARKANWASFVKLKKVSRETEDFLFAMGDLGARDQPGCGAPEARTVAGRSRGRREQEAHAVGYNKFDLFIENEEYRPFDGCKIEI